MGSTKKQGIERQVYSENFLGSTWLYDCSNWKLCNLRNINFIGDGCQLKGIRNSSGNSNKCTDTTERWRTSNSSCPSKQPSITTTPTRATSNSSGCSGDNGC